MIRTTRKQVEKAFRAWNREFRNVPEIEKLEARLNDARRSVAELGAVKSKVFLAHLRGVQAEDGCCCDDERPARLGDIAALAARAGDLQEQLGELEKHIVGKTAFHAARARTWRAIARFAQGEEWSEEDGV